MCASMRAATFSKASLTLARSVASSVPSRPTSFSWLSTQVPTAANKYSGANYQHYRNASLDPIMTQADAELDVAKRHTLIDQVYAQINKDIASLPLYPFINITAWRSDKIGVPTGPSPTSRQLARLLEWARASGRSAALPLIGGALLAFGLGIGRRHVS